MVKNKSKYLESNWALHAVKIHNMNDNDAKQEAKKFIVPGKPGRKVKFFRRLKNGTLSFRNIPKTKFIPRSYRSKKINDNITLVYGRLKPQFAALRGDGIIEDVGDFFSPRQDYNNVSRETLNKYGNMIIKKMVLYRTPIQSIINTVLNIISLGKWNSVREKYHYDKLFHLALVCTLNNGKNIIIEKNAVVNISDYYETKPDTEVYDDINLNKEITPKQMLDETLAQIGPEKFFIYDPVNANCQVFLRDVLSSQGLYNNNINGWLFQPLDELMKEMPGWTYPISKLGARVSAVFNKLFGYGRPEGTTAKRCRKKAPIVISPQDKLQGLIDSIKVTSDFIKKTKDFTIKDIDKAWEAIKNIEKLLQSKKKKLQKSKVIIQKI